MSRKRRFIDVCAGLESAFSCAADWTDGCDLLRITAEDVCGQTKRSRRSCPDYKDPTTQSGSLYLARGARATLVLTGQKTTQTLSRILVNIGAYSGSLKEAPNASCCALELSAPSFVGNGRNSAYTWTSRKYASSSLSTALSLAATTAAATACGPFQRNTWANTF